MNFLEESLFTTNSIKIASSGSPFWYTSGTIGPYFINTHFLYGGEKYANELLKFIDENKNNYKTFLTELTERVIDFYNSNNLFKNIMDIFYLKLKDNTYFKKCEYISGGERRDWFFSPVISYLSNKKLLYIYKDLNVYYLNEPVSDLNNADVCHICDLITQASSHKRAWIPAIKNIKGNIILNASIVDRDEGAGLFLKKENIKNISMVIINNKFLRTLTKNKIIDNNQALQIINFKNDPDKFGIDFITKNPDFMIKSLDDAGIKSKAERCINENPYKIDFNKILNK